MRKKTTTETTTETTTDCLWKNMERWVDTKIFSSFYWLQRAYSFSKTWYPLWSMVRFSVLQTSNREDIHYPLPGKVLDSSDCTIHFTGEKQQLQNSPLIEFIF
jgi:hypothetical protein